MSETVQTVERPCSVAIKTSAKGAYSLEVKAYGATTNEALESAIENLSAGEKKIKSKIASADLLGEFYG